MQNLINFIIRNNAIIVFLVFQFLAFRSIIHFRVFQNSVSFQVGTSINGSIYNTVSDIEQYFLLKELNDSLVKENAKLKQNLQPYLPGKIFGDTISIDSTGYYGLLRLIPAKVIRNSTNAGQNNYLTLDKGALQGIKEDMAVLSENGIVGVVNGVSDNFASVVPLLHQGFRTSGRIKRNNDVGKISWNGEDPNFLTMADIGDYSDVRVGDTIITTSYSSIFPENIPIGIVRKVGRKAGSNYYDLDIEPLTRFSSLYYVYAVEDLIIEEREQLENQYQFEE